MFFIILYQRHLLLLSSMSWGCFPAAPDAMRISPTLCHWWKIKILKYQRRTNKHMDLIDVLVQPWQERPDALPLLQDANVFHQRYVQPFCTYSHGYEGLKPQWRHQTDGLCFITSPSHWAADGTGATVAGSGSRMTHPLYIAVQRWNWSLKGLLQLFGQNTLDVQYHFQLCTSSGSVPMHSISS